MVEILKDAAELRSVLDAWIAECSGELEEYGISFSKERCLQSIQMFCDIEIADVLVSKHVDELVGFVVMVKNPSLIGPDIMATEQYFYVTPLHRGWHGIALIEAAEKWAKEKDCTHLIMTASQAAGKLFDKACKLYERYGMRPTEAGFVKTI